MIFAQAVRLNAVKSTRVARGLENTIVIVTEPTSREETTESASSLHVVTASNTLPLYPHRHHPEYT